MEVYCGQGIKQGGIVVEREYWIMQREKGERVFRSSRVAQWYRVGLITQRSEDRNLSLLYFLVSDTIAQSFWLVSLACVYSQHLVSLAWRSYSIFYCQSEQRSKLKQTLKFQNIPALFPIHLHLIQPNSSLSQLNPALLLLPPHFLSFSSSSLESINPNPNPLSIYLKIQCQSMLDNPQNPSQQPQELESPQVAGFIAKTFQILKNDEFNKIAYWAPSGSEFIIKDINKFQQIVLPRYFRHNKINSFVRQLNMADHSKSVFSHPSFLRDRDDLLITIKRKIKGKLESETPAELVTPTKVRGQAQTHSTTAKQSAETGNELTSFANLQNMEPNNTSFNLIYTREKLHSIMNLNFTVNNFPQVDMEQQLSEQESQERDECVSIEHKIQGQDDEPAENNRDGCNFMNPSCFFESMRRQE